MELRGTLESTDVSEIRQKTDALNEASRKLAEVLYAQATAQAQSPTGGNGDALRGRGRRGRRLRGDRRGRGEDVVTDEPRVEEQEEIVDEPAAEESAPAPDESYLRLAADFDNYRKRVAREQVELTAANERLLNELLPVLDDPSGRSKPRRSTRRRSRGGRTPRPSLAARPRRAARALRDRDRGRVRPARPRGAARPAGRGPWRARCCRCCRRATGSATRCCGRHA